MRVLAARVVAAVAGVGILLVAAWGVLWIMLAAGISSQAPDPFIADGDPCCGHPDTWGEVAGGVAWTLGLVLLDALLVVMAVVLLSWAATRCWPRLSRLALVPSGALAAAIFVIAALLVPVLDEAVTAPSCDTFAFSRVAFRTGEDHERKTMAHGVARCELVQDKTPLQVRRLLGPPTARARIDERKTYWDYARLIVYFTDGRVAQTTATA